MWCWAEGQIAPSAAKAALLEMEEKEAAKRKAARLKLEKMERQQQKRNKSQKAGSKKKKRVTVKSPKQSGR